MITLLLEKLVRFKEMNYLCTHKQLIYKNMQI